MMGMIATGLSSVLYSAEPSFSINSYIPERFTDFKWQIGGNLRLNGGYTDYHVDDYSPYPRFENGSRSSDMQTIQFNTTASYRYETIPRFLYLATTLAGGFNHRNLLSSNDATDTIAVIDRTNSDSDIKSYDFRVGQNIDVGQYLVGDAFISAGGYLSMSYGESSNEQTGSDIDTYWLYPGDTVVVQTREMHSDSPSNQKSYSLDFRIMPGWGRIYEGQYAATAMYMINELKGEEVLKRAPGPGEMRELTEIVYQYKLSHAIDKRLHKIEALSRIMDYLRDNDIIDDTGPYGYLLIQDVWDYFPTYYRRFGYKFRAGAGIVYQTLRILSSREQQNHYTTESYDFNDPVSRDTIDDLDLVHLNSRYRKSENRRPYLSVLAEYCRPFNLRWQMDLTGDFRYYPNAYTTTIDHSIFYSGVSFIKSYDILMDTYIDYNAYHLIDLQGLVRYIYDSRTFAEFAAIYNHLHYNSSRRSNLFDKRVNQEFVGLPERSDLSRGLLTLRGSVNYRISIPTLLSINLEYTKSEDEVYRESTSQEDGHSYNIGVAVSHSLY